MLKKLPILFLFIFVTSFFVTPVSAQTATDSGTATDSATASDSGVVLDSSDSATLPETLPITGANDVLILTAAGVIFLVAGITIKVGTEQVFNEVE